MRWVLYVVGAIFMLLAVLSGMACPLLTTRKMRESGNCSVYQKRQVIPCMVLGLGWPLIAYINSAEDVSVGNLAAQLAFISAVPIVFFLVNYRSFFSRDRKK